MERGEDPMGIVRDPEENEPYIPIRHEGVARDGYARVGAEGRRVGTRRGQGTWN